jgi:hypothetical protein
MRGCVVTAFNHNGGPPDLPLTAKTKLECIQSILEREDLTAAQKCIGAGIVLEADRQWTAEVKTPTLQRYANVKDRETVFRATRELDKKAVISKSSARGQAGKFTVLPPRVVKAIVEAYDEIKSGRGKADQFSESGRVKPDGTSGGTSGRHSTSDAVGFDRTSPESGRVPADQSGALSRAGCSNKYNNNKLLASSDDSSAREAGQLAILNGAKALMVEQLATWLSPYAPDTATAEKWLVSATTMHGGAVVKEAFSELQAQIASGDLVSRPIVVLNRICERVKKGGLKKTNPAPTGPTVDDLYAWRPPS